jgi:hypothetical protein
MLVLMIVLVAFMAMIVIVAFVDLRPFSRLRLGIVFEGVGRTQRFAFRALERAPIHIRFMADLPVAKSAKPNCARLLPNLASSKSIQPPPRAAAPWEFSTLWPGKCLIPW